MKAFARWAQRNPVLALGLVSAVLTGALSAGVGGHLFSDTVAAWIAWGVAVVNVAGAWAAHNASTALVDPRNVDGTPLVPIDRPPAS